MGSYIYIYIHTHCRLKYNRESFCITRVSLVLLLLTRYQRRLNMEACVLSAGFGPERKRIRRRWCSTVRPRRNSAGVMLLHHCFCVRTRRQNWILPASMFDASTEGTQAFIVPRPEKKRRSVLHLIHRKLMRTRWWLVEQSPSTWIDKEIDDRFHRNTVVVRHIESKKMKDALRTKDANHRLWFFFRVCSLREK
jgi:hypothetical protein